MNDNKYQYYLEDIGKMLKEKSLEVKKDLLKEGDDYNKGRLYSYYEIISLLQEQANAFDIDLKSINLDDINPDKDLLI